jgi:hypothetical protein
MYLYDENDKIIDAECGFDRFGGSPCIVIESSGGADPTRGVNRRNPDYNRLLSLLFHRLAKADAQITCVVLDSGKVSDLPVDKRVANLTTGYPIDLNSVDIEDFRKMLQREIAKMHRAPNAKRGGNAQKKIRKDGAVVVSPNLSTSDRSAWNSHYPLSN